jgi:FRG domain
MNRNVDVMEYRGALEFVECVRSLLLDEKAPEMVARYIFRGQGDASWQLVPSAFRSNTILGYESRQFCRISDTTPKRTWDQGNAELTALMEFLQLADNVGLDIPADHKWLRLWNPFHNVVGHDIGTEDWPPQELYEALALAQHHGVPTRLLDFTYDPLIAAFFAAEQPPRGSEQIAVWCVDLQALNLAASETRRPVEIVTVSRAQNRNLTAQKALFVLDRDARLARSQTLDQILEEHVKGGVVSGVLAAGSRAVRKFCLPTGESSALLDLLTKLGIDHAHLMPSFDGVVKELNARRERQTGREVPRVGEDN